MRFQGREISPTRSTAVALRDEHRLIREGYEFLDEKRMLLAAEVLRQLEVYRETRARYRNLHADGREALMLALEYHGLDGLTVFPAPNLENARLATGRRRFLGVDLVEASLEAATAEPPDGSPVSTPEARQCAEAYCGLLHFATELAAVSGNLRRLMKEYRETERRARALENVLLPELLAAMKQIDEHLEAAEQEEAVLVRHAGRPL